MYITEGGGKITYGDEEEIELCEPQSKVWGVFGKIELKVGTYLIVIDGASVVGEIFGSLILVVDSLRFIPLHASGEIDLADEEFVAMIQKLQSDKAFYFSYTFDLTRS